MQKMQRITSTPISHPSHTVAAPGLLFRVVNKKKIIQNLKQKRT